MIPSGLWQARGRHTDAGVTWPSLDRDPEVGWCQTGAAFVAGS